MKTLDQCKWKAFVISEIAYVGTGANIPKQQLTDGNIPRISATDANNGVESFTVKHSSIRNYRTYKNCISISFLGSCFYQPYEASYDMKIHNIQLKEKELNKHLALFIATQCKRFCEHINYGNQLSSSDLPKQKIMLPVTAKDEPDWAFMEEYMKAKEYQLLMQYQKHIAQVIDNQQITPPHCANNKQWRAFRIGDIFTTYTGGDMIISKLQIGTYPLISHSACDNGVAMYITKQEKIKLFDHHYTLSLADRGNFKAFTQQEDFYIGTRVKALELKEPIKKYASKHLLLFFSKVIDAQAVKFCYGSNCTNSLDKLPLMLPTTSEGSPDYEYMANYMRNIETKLLQRYIDTKLHIISA